MANGKNSGSQAKDLTVILRVAEQDLANVVVQGYNTGRNLELTPKITTE